MQVIRFQNVCERAQQEGTLSGIGLNVPGALRAAPGKQSLAWFRVLAGTGIGDRVQHKQCCG